MAQTQKAKTTTKKAEPEKSTEAADVKDDELAQATEDLLDEIDSVLEENAEEFVRSYVQQGGQ